MKNPLRIFTVIIFIVAAASAGISIHAQTKRHEVVGYFPSWKSRTGDHILTPEKIPFGMLTVINYAFFYPLPDGTIVGKDTAGDAILLRRRAPGKEPKGGSPLSLTEAAHRRGDKVLLSLGGWEDSNNFPAVAADPARAARFAHSCAAAIREFGFDGIDIDWEFPGFVEHNGTPADGENYVGLLRRLRDTLDSAGRHRGRRLLLTAALPADRKQALAMEIHEAARLLDFLNVMTYDFFGAWDAQAYHNSPLFAGPGGDSARTVDGAFRLYTREFGIPGSKINLGVPFYGHTFTGCTQLSGQHGPADTVHFGASGAFYSGIVSQMAHFTKHWDDRAKVPYLTSREWTMLVSYDDAESVAEKGRYAESMGARGLIIWEITGDYMADGSHPLLEAIDRVFHASH